MRFIGLDLTDPYARRPRCIDVALVDEQGNCEFSTLPGTMTGVSGSAFLEPISARPNSGDVLIIDGPLGLAEAGKGLRQCERTLATPGKTPDVLPTPGTKPFAGFVRCAWLGWTIHREPTRIILVGRQAFRAGSQLREGAIVQISASPI